MIRSANWAGIQQFINPNPGDSYIISAKFRLLNKDEDKLWHQVEIWIREVYPSGLAFYKHCFMK